MVRCLAQNPYQARHRSGLHPYSECSYREICVRGRRASLVYA